MNKYEDINFDAFAIDSDETLTDTEKNTLKSNFYESAGIAENHNERNSKKIRRFSRKFVALTAAMVLVFAFGAVAYATDMFGLGILKYEWGQEETAYPEDSVQFKALEEYESYLATLSDEEYHEYIYTEDGTINPKNDKLKEVLKKYNLVYPDQTKTTYAESADEMFDNAGIPNFLGDANGYNRNQSDYDPGFINYEVGEVEIAMDINPDLYYSGKNHMVFEKDKYRIDDWHIQCLEKNVFPENATSPWGWKPYDKEDDSITKWAYTTDDGAKVKCTGSIVNETLTYDEVDKNFQSGKINEMPITYAEYSMIANFDEYTILLHYMVSADSDTKEISKDVFEKFLDDFDFTKLN